VSRLRAQLCVFASSLATLATAFIVGCASSPSEGWTVQSIHRTDIKSIAVPIFENSTYEREIGFELTDAVIKELELKTSLAIVPETRADTVLLGRVRRVQLDQLSKSRLTGLSEESLYGVTIDFEWKDLRTGHTLIRRESFAGQGLFVPSTPTGEPIQVGQFAVVQQLAHDLVAELAAQW
jgi:hypothetical protein